jgi:two-component system, chemotaxis family, CheB/CheR fusion protein
LLELDTGLPVEQLKEPIRRVLSDDSHMLEEQLDAVTRTGKAARMRVRTLPLRRGGGGTSTARYS